MTTTQNSKFISLLLILFSFAIILFITKNQFYNYNLNSDKNSTLNSGLIEKNTELQNLSTLEQDLLNGTKKKEIQWFSNKFTEDAILKYFYNYISKDNSWVDIKNISLKDSKKWEFGFSEATVNLDVSIGSKSQLKDFLNFLTSRNSEYTFFVQNFSFDYNSTFDWTYDVSIPLKIFYK